MRSAYSILLLFGVIIFGSAYIHASTATHPWTAIQYSGTTYVSLDDVSNLLGAVHGFTAFARGIHVDSAGKHWEFLNGGDRWKGPDSQEHLLKHPLLVVQGTHFVALDEARSIFGFELENESQIKFKNKTISIQMEPFHTAVPLHVVENLVATQETLKLTSPVIGYKTLDSNGESVLLSKAMTLLVRRRLLIDGVPYVLASSCSPESTSYLLRNQDLRDTPKIDASSDPSCTTYRKWLSDLVAQGQGFQFSESSKTSNEVAVTIDLCWSLRAYEALLFKTLVDFSKVSRHPVSATVFVTGRWIDQHPEEMSKLINLSRGNPRINFVWSGHSFAHPKSGAFMNAFNPEEFRSDTLAAEQSLLKWGIAPSVYYRFPGLVHDRVRLEEVSKLGLLPIDASSWMAYLGIKNPNDPTAALEFKYPDSGSVILVHGNGNEPEGIPVFTQWLAQHRDWKLMSLDRLMQH